jgi:hypothetical protein
MIACYGKRLKKRGGLLKMLYLCCTYERKNRCKILNYSGLDDLKVTPKGLEPPTNRTGICHSIQLNYGAISF